MDKEFIYVGYYTDTQNRFILKIGTTNDLKRRQIEHTRNYKRAKSYTMPQEAQFIYLWFTPLSKYNTLRYEDSNRRAWQEAHLGEFVRNDRFVLDADKPSTVKVKIRKEYVIALPQ